MKSRQATWIFSMILIVGILSGVTVGGKAAARQNSPVLPASTTLATTAYLPIAYSQFPYGTIFGVEIGPVFEGHGFDEMAVAGISWIRINWLNWAEVEPERGDRLWNADLDSRLLEAAGKRLQTILVIESTPDWAQAFPGSTCGPIKPEEYETFAAFVHDAVVRYSAAPYSVKYFEIWNEPDVPVNNETTFGCWGNPGDPYYGGQAYGEMLKVVYPQLKAANPDAQALLGGLLLDCNPDTGTCADPTSAMFLDGILQTGAESAFDGVSFHAYDYYQGDLGQYRNMNWGTSWDTTGPVSIAKAQFIREKLDAANLSEKFLINTESAILADAGCDDICELTKAYYVTEVYASAIAEGLVGNIWYTAMGWRNSGLLKRVGNDLEPRLAYTAYSFARDELLDASLVEKSTLHPKVSGYEFDLHGQRILVLWSLDGYNHEVTLPWVPARIWSAFGEEIPVPGFTYTVTAEPIYFERTP